MLHDAWRQSHRTLHVDEVLVEFSLAHEETKVSLLTLDTHCLIKFSRGQLGDYGYFTGSERFYFKGNIFVDIKSLISEADTVPRQHRVTTGNLSRAVPVNSAQSLPRNSAFNSLLASLSSRYPNAYLVTMIVRCAPESETMCTCLTIVSDSCISFQI